MTDAIDIAPRPRATVEDIDEWRRLIREVVERADRLHKLRVDCRVEPDRSDLARLGTAKSYLDGAMWGDPRCALPGPEPKIAAE